MSFFNSEHLANTGSMEMGGGDIEPIPAKTQVKASIDEATWYEPKDGGDKVISLQWSVLAPKEYANRKVFQKLKVTDSDDKKKNKAMMMLAAIDKNCGGKIAKANRVPDNDDLMMALLNKPMVLLLQIWAMEDKNTGETKRGNWVASVSPLNAQAAAPAPAPATAAIDDDIPW
jgi:Protein of unknown function (DUF669)